MQTRLLAVLAIACAATACKGERKTSDPLRIAAASDLAFALKEIGDRYGEKTGDKVTFSFGSTGLLAKQIAEGAPFDVFAAANVSFADEAVASGRCFGPTKTLYARGRIVVFTSDPDKTPPKLVELTDPRFVHIAIANPDHAPYGQAAKQALIKAGIWESVRPRLVFGENIQQTLQFAQSGNADVAIVALSLGTVSKGRYSEIAVDMHEPIDQALVVCKGAGGQESNERAARFTAFVNSKEGRDVMRRYGFLLPTESMPEARHSDTK